MNVFIVRPFGVKEGIDFDRVEKELIQPALQSIGISGGTTGEIVKAGNIRHDMFQQLLVADLVIVDISLHNANIFYELGIRHALRDKRTILIRCSGIEVPLNLKTDRYLTYDAATPASCLPTLIDTLRDTIASHDKDSPVFLLLPQLATLDPRRFLVVPRDFREEVERARAHQWPGDLRLLAEEVRGLYWETEGLRHIGKAQMQLTDYRGSRDTWERVRQHAPDDLEANLLLGTIYQRLGDLTRSDQAIERLLPQESISAGERAEAYALRGCNAKARWQDEWGNWPEVDQPAQALRSAHLLPAINAFQQAYLQDLNHYYYGIKALALLAVMTNLADRFPNIWESSFDSDDEAARQRKRLSEQYTNLASAVVMALEAESKRLERAKKEDVWFDITSADLRCLTSARPERVAQAYRAAFQRIDPFSFDSAAKQLLLLRALGVRKDNVRAALEEIGTWQSASGRPEKEPLHVLLFTGHMIDQANRAEPRFPAAKEPAAREEIAKKVTAEMARVGGPLVGMAGCACGGDILFHEVCGELGIVTIIFLALPREQYIVSSVQHGGPHWVDRFTALIRRLETRILAQTKELPGWLGEKNGYSIWQRNNLWTFFNASALGGANMTLIALWDGLGGDGPGGTEEMVRHARANGAKTIIIDTKSVFS